MSGYQQGYEARSTAEQIVRHTQDHTSVRFTETRGWRSEENIGPKGKSDIDDAVFQPSLWSRFKFVVWVLIAIALVGGAIAAGVIMVNKNNKNDERDAEFFPPSAGNVNGTSSINTTVTGPADTDGSLVIMQNPPFTVPSGWTALWWEEFDGDKLNPQWWSYDVGYGRDYGLWAWGNQEQQYYTDKEENVRVADGKLYITALKKDVVLEDGYTFKYTSGRITTNGKLAVFGGMKTQDGRRWGTIRVEVSCKSPTTTVGLWAAVWMLPRDFRYGTWASSGEIDIYEMKNEFLQNNMALHYRGPYPEENKRYNVFEPRPGGGAFFDDFVPVAVDWSPTRIAMSISGQEQMSMKSKSVDPKGYYSVARDATSNAPFDIPFYLIANLAVGGKYPGNATEASVFPNTLACDYFRIFGKAT